MTQSLPLKNQNSQKIESIFRYQLETSVNSQYDIGVQKYGTELHTFNGRSAYLDAMEELVDLGRYLTQLEIERDWYREQYEELKFRLDSLEK